MLKIGFMYALRNIFRTPLRSFLTLFSIGMILSLYILLTAVTDSFAGQAEALMKQSNIDIIVQSKFSVSPLSSRIKSNELQDIVSLKDVSSFMPLVVGKKRLRSHRIVYLLGIDHFSDVSSKLGLSIVRGKMYDSNKDEIMLADSIFKTGNYHLGDMVSFLGSKEYKIVGTYHSWISFFNGTIIGNLNSIRGLLGKKQKTNILFLSLSNPAKTKSVIYAINKNNPYLNAIQSSDLSNTFGSTKSLFYLSDIISIITLIIAAAILINTFIIAIHERIREIGILNAIGWNKSMIVYIFMAESALLAIGGGLLGYINSIFILQYIRASFPNLIMYLPETLNMSRFMHSLTICIAISVFSVIPPALYVSGITIAKALRNGH